MTIPPSIGFVKTLEAFMMLIYLLEGSRRAGGIDFSIDFLRKESTVTRDNSSNFFLERATLLGGTRVECWLLETSDGKCELRSHISALKRIARDYSYGYTEDGICTEYGAENVLHQLHSQLGSGSYPIWTFEMKNEIFEMKNEICVLS